MSQSTSLRRKEGELFFRQWLRSPKSMGSVLPSSRALARAVASAVRRAPDEYVVELGGGTGSITQGLIDWGVPREKIVVVELDQPLYDYLADHFPGCRVIRGDATRLTAILEREGIDKVGTVISGLPMLGMPLEFHKAITDQGLGVTGGRGSMLQYSYSPVPPIPAKRLGIRADLIRYVLWNVPPATVWRYRRA